MSELINTARRLKDLPKNGEAESTFHPYCFVSRKFLINIKDSVRKDIKPKILSPPDNVAGYESNGYYRRPVTWSMVMDRRRQRQKIELENKRIDYDFIHKIPLFVWVFFCPGISGVFEGWWLYFKGREDYYGGGFKGSIGDELLKKVIKLFPLVEVDLFGNFNFELWKERFAKKYQQGTWAGKPQGLVPVWTLVKGHQVIDILEII
jgi:hypothetical protein